MPFFQVLLRKQFHSTSQTFFKHFKTQKNKNEKKIKRSKAGQLSGLPLNTQLISKFRFYSASETIHQVIILIFSFRDSPHQDNFFEWQLLVRMTSRAL